MTSRISWLDASADEQRRVREIVQLFSQKETQDELGGRRIVVALSDALFPGTSVLHSRARYLLFTPWFVKRAAGRKDPVGSLDWFERQMIKTFIADESVPSAERTDGLIGIVAGPKVKQLPSVAYWTALEAWGILQVPGTIRETLDRTRHQGKGPGPDEADELAERRLTVWHPGVGEAPTTFPVDDLNGGFRLTESEAVWLRERLLSTTEGTLLAHLAHSHDSLTDSWAPWVEPAGATASSTIREVIDDAERFSIASWGARLLYHLMLSERYVDNGFDGVAVDLDDTRAQLDTWAEEIAGRAALFDRWEPEAFWARVRGANARIDERSRLFYDGWFDLVRHGDVSGIADDQTLREVVETRERSIKKGQARLVNTKLMAVWQGGQPAQTTYRWGNVKVLLRDLHEGLHGDAGT